MKYPIAERFKSIQGEGTYTGTPIAFIRFVGCSVGKTVCTHCDTDFEQMQAPLGGGLYSTERLVEWIKPYDRICLTGGEPLDRDLQPLLQAFDEADCVTHIETSGTKLIPSYINQYNVWITVSPRSEEHTSELQ